MTLKNCERVAVRRREVVAPALSGGFSRLVRFGLIGACVFLLGRTEAQTTPGIDALKLYAGLTLTGAVNSSVSVQAADVLTPDDWRTITNVVLPSSPYVWVDSLRPADGQRFYRAVVPTNGWAPLDISGAAKYNIISTGTKPADLWFTFNGGTFASSSWLRNYGYAEPGIPDDGLVPIPGVADPGYFKVLVPSAIMISGPQGRQPLAVTITLSGAQRQRYSRLAVMHGTCWGDGVFRATLHYDTGGDAVVNLTAFDWSTGRSTPVPGVLKVATVSRDTHPQFGATTQIYSQTVAADSGRTLESITFSVYAITPPSGVSQTDAAKLFTVGILGVSGLR